MCDMLKRFIFSFLCFYVALTSKAIAKLRNSLPFGFLGGLSNTCDQKSVSKYKNGQVSYNTAIEYDRYKINNYAESNLND